MVFFSCPVIDQGARVKLLRISLQLSRFPTYTFTFYTHKSPATLVPKIRKTGKNLSPSLGLRELKKINFIGLNVFQMSDHFKFYLRRQRQKNGGEGRRNVNLLTVLRKWLGPADCDNIYTVYLSLYTQSADPNPFRGKHCTSKTK